MTPHEFCVFGDFAGSPVEDVRFIRLAAPSIALPAAPRFVFGALSGPVSTEYYSMRGLASVGVFVARNIEVSDACVLRRGETIYTCPELNIYPPQVEVALARRDPLSAGTRRPVGGRCVMFLGPGYTVYGHWLVEYLPKLSLLVAAGYHLEELRYLVPSDTPRWGIALLRAVGIRPEMIVEYDPVCETIVSDEILMPTILHNGNRVSPLFRLAAGFIRSAMERQQHDTLPASGAARLFVSRRRASQSRPLANRTEIEELAQRYGFDIVYPEQLSIWSQARLFAGAQYIIGEYGSALHGCIFSGRGTVVCALRGDAAHPVLVQSGLGKVLRHPTGYVFGRTDPSDPGGRFTVPLDEFEACLRLVFDGALSHELLKPELGPM